jgi:hypothetical protein
VNIQEAGALDLTDAEGNLAFRTTVQLTAEEARILRIASRMMRGKRFRLVPMCDLCFAGNRGHGVMHGELNRREIDFACRCRFIKYFGETL